MTDRIEFEEYLQALLQPGQFKDYGPNGLQVEGRREVRRIASGVTASRAFIDSAVGQGADTLLVHHGLFWRGHDGRLTGWLAARVKRLMAADVNLFAYHLPLDAHPVLGNNAQLGLRLGLVADGRFGEQSLGFIGAVADRSAGLHEKPDRIAAQVAFHGPDPNVDPVDRARSESSGTLTLQALAATVQRQLGRVPVVVPGDERPPLRRIAWCTGGAQGWFEAAIAAGADAYLTGEISEPQAHLARETGVAFLACGHHATERYGAPAVAAQAAAHFGLEHVFIDIDNPA